MKTISLDRSIELDQRFQTLLSSYRSEQSHGGIPVSVRDRYELRLKRAREELRDRKTSCRLGEVLKAIGVLSEAQLTNALDKQREDEGKRLLGEILVDLGWVNQDAIRRAIDIQRVGANAAGLQSQHAAKEGFEGGYRVEGA